MLIISLQFFVTKSSFWTDDGDTRAGIRIGTLSIWHSVLMEDDTFFMSEYKVLISIVKKRNRRQLLSIGLFGGFERDCEDPLLLVFRSGMVLRPLTRKKNNTPDPDLAEFLDDEFCLVDTVGITDSNRCIRHARSEFLCIADLSLDRCTLEGEDTQRISGGMVLEHKFLPSFHPEDTATLMDDTIFEDSDAILITLIVLTNKQLHHSKQKTKI